MTSGQSIFGFFGRVAGTFLAAVFSIVIYYIVDGKTAGVIVILVSLFQEHGFPGQLLFRRTRIPSI